MTDLASLVLAVDSRQVKEGTASLDGLTAAGARAESATIGMGRSTRSAAQDASALAASAQAASRAAVGQAAGFNAVANAVHGNTVAMRETLVVGRELAVGNFTRLPGSLSILAQQFSISGKSAAGFASQILQAFGIIKTVTNAELASEAAAAAGAADAVRAVAERAQANIVAADTEVALARAAIKTAATTEELAAAQAQLATAHGAVTAAAAEATVAEVALADASKTAAAATEASAAATTIALGTIGTIALEVAVPLALLAAAFLGVKQVADDTDMKAYIATLGLTRKETERLKDTTVTWGDVAHATFQVLAEKAGTSSKAITGWFSQAFHSIGEFGKFSVSIILAAFGAMVKGVADLILNLPAIVGNGIGAAANLGIIALEKLVNFGIVGLNKLGGAMNSVFGTHIGEMAQVSFGRLQTNLSGTMKAIGADVSGTFHSIFNATEATFNAISARAVKIRQDSIKSQADAIIADRNGTKAKEAHTKALKDEADAWAKLKDKIEDEWKSQQKVNLGDADNKVTHLQGPTPEEVLGKLPDLGNQMLEMLRQISDQAQITAGVMSDSFGKVGDVLGGLLVNLAQYGEVQAQVSQAVASGAMTQAAADQALANQRDRTIATALGGLKSLFKEHSAGYKAMEAAEKAFAVIQAISTIKSIAAGAAKMFSQLGVFAFPAVAAMVAVIAALGFSGGSSTAKAPDSPEDLQKAQGAGTVLGDPTAQSQSIADSLELMSKNSTKGLDYSSAMVNSLRKIESNIGNLAAAVARSLQLSGGFFDTSGKVGSNSSGGFLGLFATTKTSSLYDQGLQFNPATVQQIIANGITGATYQVIQTISHNSGFLGIGGSTKTSYSNTTGPLDTDISTQTQLIIADLYKSVVNAAKVLGLDVGAALQTFQVEIGKISFKDLTGDAITKALDAVFSKIGDQMAGFAVSGLAGFQKAGEGLYETLMRLAKDYLTVDVALKSIGLTFGSVGVASVAMREKLIDLMGGLDQFTSQINFYYDNFLTAQEKTTFLQSQIDATFASLGIAEPQTITAFKSLVSGLDLTTDAGQAAFAALMQIAPAFYQVMTAADSAAELEKKRQALTVTLLQAQGDAEGALALQRQIELAATDDALKSLQQEIYAAQDLAKAKSNLLTAYKTESAALQSTIDKFRGFAKTLKDFRDSLFTSNDTNLSYNQALVQLMKQGGLAAGGDETALGGGLQTSAQQFLDIATQNAASLQDVDRARALVARYLDQAIGGANGQADVAQQQLDQMKTQVGALVDINESVLSVADAIKALNALLAPSPPATGGGGGQGSGGTSHPPRERQAHEKHVRDTLDKILRATEQGAVSSNQTARVLKNADRGGAIALVTDADSPLAVEGGVGTTLP